MNRSAHRGAEQLRIGDGHGPCLEDPGHGHHDGGEHDEATAQPLVCRPARVYAAASRARTRQAGTVRTDPKPEART
jgi:hypothetical protein